MYISYSCFVVLHSTEKSYLNKEVACFSEIGYYTEFQDPVLVVALVLLPPKNFSLLLCWCYL
jgi:hypothetical protein